jgi:hypothetical protein
MSAVQGKKLVSKIGDSGTGEFLFADHVESSHPA